MRIGKADTLPYCQSKSDDIAAMGCSGYNFQSIQHGILILFAGDTFLERLFKNVDGEQP